MVTGTRVHAIHPLNNYITHTFWPWSLAHISNLCKVIGSWFMRARLPGKFHNYRKGCIAINGNFIENDSSVDWLGVVGEIVISAQYLPKFGVMTSP